MIVACATDDGINLIKDHFGDAKYFYIYNVDSNDYKLIETLENHIKSDKHADPKKAKKIMDLLGSNGAQIFMNRAFGPNIKIIKQDIFPLVMHEESISKALNKIQNSYEKIENTIKKKKNLYFVINKEGVLKINDVKQKA